MRTLIVCLVGLLTAGMLLAAAPVQDPATARGRTAPRFSELVTEEYLVEAEHGTIYGIVTRPDPDAYPDLYATGQGTAGAGVPVILTYSPYNSIGRPTNQTEVLGDSVTDYFAPRGYARAVFDVVGTRESSGCYDYGGIRERETGAAVVDFLGSQEWANGKVGMIGGSYDGTTQLAAAIEQPEHLAAIIPQVAIDRWYDYAYGGGIRYFLNSENATDEGFDTPLAFDFGFGFLPPADVTQPHYADALATRVNPCERLLHTEKAYVPDPVYDEFWLERDYRKDAAKVQAAVFLEGGWLDHNVKHWDTTRFFEALPADHPKRMSIGNWRHSASQFPDAQHLRHAWFDHWLLGIDTGIMDVPAVDSEANDGARRYESTWPPVGTTTAALPLTSTEPDSSAGLGQVYGDDATFADNNPALTEDDALAGDCADSCLVFATAPLAETVRISGSPTLDLRVSSFPHVLTAETQSEVSTHFVPVLFDEAPDGTRSVVTRGFLNSRNRNGLDVSEPSTAGEVYDAPVEFWDVDYVLESGHRLGVAIMSANAAWNLPDDDFPAANTVRVEGDESGERASVLRLPVSSGHAAVGGPPVASGN